MLIKVFSNNGNFFVVSCDSINVIQKGHKVAKISQGTDKELDIEFTENHHKKILHFIPTSTISNGILDIEQKEN